MAVVLLVFKYLRAILNIDLILSQLLIVHDRVVCRSTWRSSTLLVFETKDMRSIYWRTSIILPNFYYNGERQTDFERIDATPPTTGVERVIILGYKESVICFDPNNFSSQI